LAETLMGFGRPEEAEKEYRQGLTIASTDVRFKIGLAGAFLSAGEEFPRDGHR